MRNRKIQQVICLWILAMLCLAIGIGTAFAQEEPPTTETEVIPTAETELPPPTETPTGTPTSTELFTPLPPEQVTSTPTVTPTVTPASTESFTPLPQEQATSTPTVTETLNLGLLSATPKPTDTAELYPAHLLTAPILKPFVRLNSTQLKLQWEPVPGAKSYCIFILDPFF